MSNLTEARNTKEYIGKTFQAEAGGTIYEGGLVAMNSSGKVVAAGSTTGVAGVALNGAASGEKVDVAFAGIYGFNASTTSAVAMKDIGKQVHVEDDHTVALTGGTASVPFGKVVGVDNGQILVKL